MRSHKIQKLKDKNKTLETCTLNTQKILDNGAHTFGTKTKKNGKRKKKPMLIK